MRSVLLAATGLVAAGTLAACGSSPATIAAGAPTGGSSASASTGGQVGGDSRFPGASGTIADITGSTLQVQNQTDGQVAVTYSGSTTFTAQVAAALADVKVGSCVTVTPVTSSAQGSQGTSSGSAPADAVTAAAVRISQPQNGSCTGGFGAFGAGSRPSGFPSRGASGRPTHVPSGMPGGDAAFRGFGGAGGTVASLSATGFTVTETRPDFGSGGPSAGASPSMTTSTVTVTVDGSTTYSTTTAADSSALAVGKCVTATGQADSTGAIAATRIAVSNPDSSGQCGGGFARFGGGADGAAGEGGPGGAGGPAGTGGGA